MADVGYGLQPGCDENDTSRLNICLDMSSASGRVESWFPMVKRAVQRWERIITTDPWGPWPSAYYGNLDNADVATERPSTSVDDIYIAVVVGNIDGPGRRYAEAGPTLLTGNRIVSGSIKIDPNDLQTALDDGIFEGLMMHELGHVFVSLFRLSMDIALLS